MQWLMEAWALLCPELRQGVAAAEDDSQCPQHMPMNPQSLFYLHHVRSCAASAVGCHGGQCWGSMAMTFADEHVWVDAVIDGAGRLTCRGLLFLACVAFSSLLAVLSKKTCWPLSYMVWQALMATNPVLSMAASVLLVGPWEFEDKCVLAAAIVIAVVRGWHAENKWLCRCISACCAGCLCPDDGLGIIVAILCGFGKPAFGKKGNAPAKKNASPSQSGNGAFQPAALGSAVQNVVDAMRNFITDSKRWPKQNKGTSEDERAETKLAKRWSDLKDSVPDDIMQELRALSGAAQPAGPEPVDCQPATASNSLPSASGPGAVNV